MQSPWRWPPAACRTALLPSRVSASAARASFRAADAETRLGNNAVLQAAGGQRHGDCIIARAAAEFVEAEARIRCQKRQPRLAQQLVLGERGHHHAFEKIVGG